jgi:hypothetical protein
VLPPDNAATHEHGALQHADVLGGGREGHPKRRGELAEIALSAGELPDDCSARGMSQRVEHSVESGRTI